MKAHFDRSALFGDLNKAVDNIYKEVVKLEKEARTVSNDYNSGITIVSQTLNKTRVDKEKLLRMQDLCKKLLWSSQRGVVEISDDEWSLIQRWITLD